MWWDHQNLNKPHIDATGKRWNFRVWHDVASGGHAERIFFWDDRKEFCGVVVLPVGKAVHIRRSRRLFESWWPTRHCGQSSVDRFSFRLNVTMQNTGSSRKRHPMAAEPDKTR